MAPAAGQDSSREATLGRVRAAARPLAGEDRDYDALIELIGDSRFVLLGEATHGTHEFYRERARITRRLVREKGFAAVAIEGDWPETSRVNRYIRGEGGDATAEQALSGYDRFPRWMWANTDVRDLVAWLRERNAALPVADRAGIYGLDLYNLMGAADGVVESLRRLDPQAAQRARQRYRCFARYRRDPQAYGQAASVRPYPSCEAQARDQLREVRDLRQREAPKAGPARREELFAAFQSARVVQGGEHYYRNLYRGGISPWNLRDRYMAETLEQVAAHLGQQGNPPKVVVWAHNTHMGDARVTQMGEAGEWNIGQLMRQRHDGDSVLVGFTTYTGTVLAASNWGERGRVKNVLPALPESYAGLFHEAGIGNALLVLRGNAELGRDFGEPRLERAIGVIYLPRQERQRHYFKARLSKQFDAVIHLDETRAVEPLERR